MNESVYDQLQRMLAAPQAKQSLYQTIVNAPFTFQLETTSMFLGIIVLLTADKTDGMIHRIALSDTEMAAGTKAMSVKRFEDIKIPLNYENNIIAKAIRTGEPQRTADWRYLFEPALTAEEARFNQAGGAIACSFVYPLLGVGAGGALIFSYYQYPQYIGEAQAQFMQRYSDMVAHSLRRPLT